MSEQETIDGSPALIESYGSIGSAKFNIKNQFDPTPFIRIKFQAGPLPKGINGCSIEDVIDILIARLEGFQKSDFRCRDNALAITHLEDAKLRLLYRTQKRQSQGVEGTMQVHNG